MVKAAKTKPVQEAAPKHDDTFDVRDDSGETVFDPDEPPPIDEADEYYANDGADGPDVDYLSDGNYEASDSPPDDDGSPKVPLSEAQLKRLRDGGKRLKHQIGYMSWGDKSHSYDFILNGIVVTSAKLVAIVDLTVSNRELFFGNQPRQTCPHLWIDCDGGIPPRPDSYTDKSEWEPAKYNNPKGDKKVDPWSINHILLFSDGFGGVIAFQANNAATKRAIGELLADFDGRRPIVELQKVPDDFKARWLPTFFQGDQLRQDDRGL